MLTEACPLTVVEEPFDKEIRSQYWSLHARLISRCFPGCCTAALERSGFCWRIQSDRNSRCVLPGEQRAGILIRRVRVSACLAEAIQWIQSQGAMECLRRRCDLQPDNAASICASRFKEIRSILSPADLWPSSSALGEKGSCL